MWDLAKVDNDYEMGRALSPLRKLPSFMGPNSVRFMLTTGHSR